MKIVPQSAEIIKLVDGVALMKHIERSGRICYQSEGNTTEDSYKEFIRRLIKRGHESVLEHATVSVLFTVDRGISHEIVRHRIASYSQESTRYCNYSKDSFNREIMVIQPDVSGPAYDVWRFAMKCAEHSYLSLVNSDVSPQDARDVLPTDLKTTLMATMNLRSWRNFFKQRTAKGAHPRMIKLATALLKDFKEYLPEVFEDI